MGNKVILHCGCKLFQSAVTVHASCLGVVFLSFLCGVPLGCGYFVSYHAVFNCIVRSAECNA